MRDAFAAQLRDTGYLHTLLPLDTSLSAESRQLAKPVLDSRPLAADFAPRLWETRGLGRVEWAEEKWRITAPARTDDAGALSHYSPYTDFSAVLSLDGEDWRAYNRIACRIRPVCPGGHAPLISLHLRNDGAVKIPDIYDREGAHVVGLNNRQWNDCIWEFPDLPRDRVTEFYFSVTGYGTERFAAEEWVFEIADIRLEQVESPDHALGWQGPAGAISYSTTGYWRKGGKTAVGQGLTGSFAVEDAATGEACFQGAWQNIENEKGHFSIADFSALERTGEYRLASGKNRTEAFRIAEHPMDEAVWKTLNFIYAERCGFPVGRGHSSCHADLIAEYQGKRIAYNGGWHDAGDLSQQTVQTGEVVEALFRLAQTVRKNDAALYHRLVEEACWGLDFILKTRFGDGHRAFSVGCCRWTDGIIASGDEEPVRCHNRSIDNWLLSGVQAYAAHCLAQEDADIAWVALRAAREDYACADARFAKAGAEAGEPMEHTHNASLSQFYAAASWAASMLFQATREEEYSRKAAHYGNLLLDCQDTGEAGLPFCGFFYRDESKKHIVHFNHQSREHLFAKALAALFENQPRAAENPAWEQGAKRYADYFKALAVYSAPYGMLPAGPHHVSEADDAETFALLHLLTDYEARRDDYRLQLAAGTQLENGYCIRQFPVWFSFRGNTTVQLSAAQSAAICARLLGDDALFAIAREQVYWVLGKNPFGQSLLYGEGSNYAAQYSALCGETMGQMPVGIQTCGNGDAPYWPMAINATYKEVWMSTAGHWMRLMAELY